MNVQECNGETPILESKDWGNCNNDNMYESGAYCYCELGYEYIGATCRKCDAPGMKLIILAFALCKEALPKSCFFKLFDETYFWS